MSIGGGGRGSSTGNPGTRVARVGPGDPGRKRGRSPQVRARRMMGVLAAHDLLPSEEHEEESTDDDELVDDEYDGAPEEANSDDPDEPADLDEPRGTAPFRTPAIAFAYAPPPPRRPDPQAVHLVRQRRRPEALTWATRAVVDELISSIPDREAAELWEERLDHLAATLARHQHAAITAANPPSAYHALVTMTEKQLAELADLEVSWLSRSRTLIVQCLWGPAPLEFFWWKGLSVEGFDFELCAAHRTLCANPDQPDLAIARAAAKSILPRASQIVIDQRADALRKHVPYVRRVVEHRSQVEAFREAFPHLGVAELAATLDLPTGRGLSVLRLAVLGVLYEGAA